MCNKFHISILCTQYKTYYMCKRKHSDNKPKCKGQIKVIIDITRTVTKTSKKKKKPHHPHTDYMLTK